MTGGRKSGKPCKARGGAQGKARGHAESDARGGAQGGATDERRAARDDICRNYGKPGQWARDC